MLTIPWSIVLAAGQGQRLSAITGGVPKQFWSPRGGTTLLEDTIQRIAPVTPPTQTITVINRSQQHYVDRADLRAPIGRVAVQPLDRGTAAGVLLGLSEITTPDGIAVLTPSDHGVGNPTMFQRALGSAAVEIRRGRAEIILFAARPLGPTDDYGWILPASGSTAATRFPGVGRFVEKPDADLARRLLAEGGAWNTMVIVARVTALFARFQRHLPRLARVFEEARQLGEGLRAAFLAESYPTLTSADFSRDLITPSAGLQFHVWPSSIGWTDLGTPERLHAWLRSQRRRPLAGRLHAKAGQAPLAVA